MTSPRLVNLVTSRTITTSIDSFRRSRTGTTGWDRRVPPVPRVTKVIVVLRVCPVHRDPLVRQGPRDLLVPRVIRVRSDPRVLVAPRVRRDCKVISDPEARRACRVRWVLLARTGSRDLRVPLVLVESRAFPVPRVLMVWKDRKVRLDLRVPKARWVLKDPVARRVRAWSSRVITTPIKNSSPLTRLGTRVMRIW